MDISKSVRHEKVSLLAVSDGRSVRLFGDRSRLSIHVVEAATMDSVEGELLVEQVVDLSVPKRYRELFCPGCLLATVTPRVLKPSELVEAACERDLLKTLDDLLRDLRATETAVTT